MKLNNRLWLTIIPVIISTYLLVFTGLYQYEKESYLRHENTQLALHTSELNSLYSRYDTFSDNYFLSLLQNSALHQLIQPEAADMRAFSIERNLTNALEALNDLRFEKATFSLIDNNLNVTYFYEHGGDPFAAINPRIKAIAKNLLATKQTSHKSIEREADTVHLTKSQIIDRYTLRPPKNGRYDNSVVISLTFSLGSFTDMLKQLKEEQQYSVHWLTSDNIASAAETEIPKQIQNIIKLTEQTYLLVEKPQQAINAYLRELLAKTTLIALGLIVFSSLILIILIERYITEPIKNLEQSLLSAEDSYESLPKPPEDKDEISSLSRAFYQLHEKLSQSYRDSKKLSETDSLTKLYNRRKFNDCLTRLTQRERELRSIALLYIDIDNFKHVNDNYGHHAGDILLQEFSEQLSSTIRTTDFVFYSDHDIARLAGDEFSVILHDLSSETGVIKVAERILALFNGGLDTSAGQFPVSASIGIAIYPRDGKTTEELIAHADSAMYQAKKSGKNQFKFYSADLAKQVQRISQIENALKRKQFSEFSIHYMPTVNADSGELSGAEALIRWHSPTLGYVSPAEFIPIAESKGLLEDLDLSVINQVLQDLPALRAIIGQQARVAINISSAVLNSGTFFLELMKIKSLYRITDNNIALEITETFSAKLSPRVEANLRLFKQAGFKLALDDFGSGYTSLTQLIDYPIDIIKIDKSLVDRMTDDEHDLVIALISFCKKRGHSVTAEGVETKAQALQLTSAGVDDLQGFYIAKAMPMKQLKAYVQENWPHLDYKKA